MSALLLVACLNLSVPESVYEEIDIQEASERAIQQDLRERSSIRLNGEDGSVPHKSTIQIKNRGLKNSRTNISVGFPI